MTKKQRPDWVDKEIERTVVGKIKRGGTNNKSRLEGFGEVSASNGADWGSCSPEKLLAVVVLITSLGGAMTIGLSRDRGAHSLTLLLDGNHKTLWFNGDAVLDDELDMIVGTLEGLT